MGGTSTDVAFLRGEAQVMPEFRLGGLPLRRQAGALTRAS